MATRSVTATSRWRQRGWELADFYRLDLMDEFGYHDDDEMRVAKIRELYPDSMPSARTAMREGWRRHRAGEEP